MKLRTAVSLFILGTVVLFSCTKEKSNEIATSLPNSSYLPHTTGSYWHYEDTISHTGFTLKATDQMDSVDKIRFYIYQNIPDDTTQDTSTTEIGQSGSDYYVRSFLSQLGDAPLLILKEDGDPGETWTQPGPDIPGLNTQALLTFKIVKRDFSKTVNGKPYHAVTQVSISATVESPGGSSIPGLGGLSIPVGSIYFAKGIGIIEMNLDAQTEGSVYLVLTDYKVQ